MDFKLSEEQLDIKKAVQKFTKGEFTKEKAMEFDVKEEFPFDLWKKACKLGFMGVRLPEEYGGQGLGMLEGVLIIEELCRADSSLGAAITLATFGYGLILKYGTEEQKKKYLPPLTRGEAISAGAFTEPEHGSDITFLSTRAVKDGEEYVVNGTKTLITNGDIADFIVVLCQTNPEAKPSYLSLIHI